jgi:hypothetical protein
MTEQFLEQNAMKRAPHRAYSRDLAPPAFDLFGNVKQLLLGQEFPRGGGTSPSDQRDCGGIEKVTLENVQGVQ